MNRVPTLATNSLRTMPLALSLLSAGTLQELGDDYELLDVNEMITNGREGFAAFIVTGDSMVDQIHPGHIVFVDTWATPKNGDIVVSSVRDAVNVKIYQNGHHGLYLVPKNKDYQTREITPEDNFNVIGVVRAHLAIHR